MKNVVVRQVIIRDGSKKGMGKGNIGISFVVMQR